MGKSIKQLVDSNLPKWRRLKEQDVWLPNKTILSSYR